MTRPAPMADGPLAALARRVEAEEPSFDLWSMVAIGLPDTSNFDWARYYDLLNIGAYRDAAAMLQPEGWLCDKVSSREDGHVALLAELWHPDSIDEHRSLVVGAHAFARAHLAACLRARAALLDGGALGEPEPRGRG